MSEPTPRPFYGSIALVLGIGCMVAGVTRHHQHVEDEAARQFDQVTYITANTEHGRWAASPDLDIYGYAFYVEPGSTHQGDFHCQVGQKFDGTEVTVCCKYLDLPIPLCTEHP